MENKKADELDEYLFDEGLSEVVGDPEISEREAALRGFASEFTLGFSDNIEAALSLAWNGNYDDKLEAARELNRIAEKQHPGKFKGGEYGAMVVQLLPAIVSGAGTLPAFARVLAKFGLKKAPKLAVNVAKKQIKAVKNLKLNPKMTSAQKRLAKEKAQRDAARAEIKSFSEEIINKDVGKNILAASGIGAAQGIGHGDGDTFFEDLQNATKGATIGGLTGIIMPFGKVALKGSKEFSTNALERFTNLTQNQFEWIKNNKAIFRAAKSLSDVKENFLQGLNKIAKKEKGFLEKANKSLSSEQQYPQSVITEPIDAIKAKYEQKILQGNTPAIAEDAIKFFDKLDQLKEKVVKGKFGYDPSSELVSEQNIMSLYKQLELDAYKYKKQFSSDQNEMYAKALREIRFQYKDFLANSNPEWNKAMEPVRRIEKLMGGDSLRPGKGLREEFGVELNPKTGEYEAVIRNGKEKINAVLKNTLGAPFVKNGLENEQYRRNLLDDFQDLYSNIVEAPKAKLGPVKVKTSGKVIKPSIREQGEAAYMESIAGTQGPRTGEQLLDASTAKAGLKKAGMQEDGAAIIGNTLAYLKNQLGKRLASEAVSRDSSAITVPFKKFVGGAERMVDIAADPMAAPRLITKESFDEPPGTERREGLQMRLDRKRRQAKPGEKFSIGPFEGKKSEKVITPPNPTVDQNIDQEIDDESLDDYLFDNQDQKSSMMNQIKQKEDEEMEKKKLSFLGQQGGNKARYS